MLKAITMSDEQKGGRWPMGRPGAFRKGFNVIAKLVIFVVI